MIIYRILCEDDLEFMVSDKELESIKRQIKMKTTLVQIKSSYVRKDLIRSITLFDDVPTKDNEKGYYNYTIGDPLGSKFTIS